MRFLSIIGIGAGNPDFLTLQAVKAMAACDVLFVADKGEVKSGLRELRQALAATHAPQARTVEFAVPQRPERSAVADYRAAIAGWRDAVEAEHARLIAEEVAPDGRGGLLVWGDPALYDGTLRTIARLHAAGQPPFEYDVIPGISAVSALTAAHRVPLNRIAEPIAITTGNALARDGMTAPNTAVMLDGDAAFAAIDPEGLEIFWGGHLGTPDEVLVAGPLAKVRDRIVETRKRSRSKVGWIMDTYLIRRSTGDD